jgi:geranylgeranyl diphosphate synthase, type I
MATISLNDPGLSPFLEAIETELRGMLASGGPPYDEYDQMLHYHMGWLDENMQPGPQHAGKRVRPLLALLSCEAAGGSREVCLPAAAAVELLHNFSLLHDDIQDESRMRRGRPTVWWLWGKPQAINAGDGLFAIAHLALTRLPERGVPLGRAWAAFQAFDQTCLDLTRGQHLDMRFENRLDVTVAEYFEMVHGKTAALIATATFLGALLAGGAADTVEQYRSFGHHLGVAFQIRDDLLGIWGDEALIGKSTSMDIETRKKTLPVVYGLQKSPALRKLYTAPRIDAEQVDEIVAMLVQLGAREAAEELAAENHEQALDALEQSGATDPAGEMLRQLADSLLARAL